MNDYNQPSVNVDGTPMINSAIDIKGNPLGLTDSYNTSLPTINSFTTNGKFGRVTETTSNNVDLATINGSDINSNNSGLLSIKKFSFSKWVLMTIFGWILIPILALLGFIFLHIINRG